MVIMPINYFGNIMIYLEENSKEKSWENNLFEAEGVINITRKFYSYAIKNEDMLKKRANNKERIAYEKIKKLVDAFNEETDNVLARYNESTDDFDYTTQIPIGVFKGEYKNFIVVVGQVFQIKEEVDGKYDTKDYGKKVIINSLFSYGSFAVGEGYRENGGVRYYFGEERIMQDGKKIKVRSAFPNDETNPYESYWGKELGRQRKLSSRMKVFASNYYGKYGYLGKIEFLGEVASSLDDAYLVKEFCIKLNPKAKDWIYQKEDASYKRKNKNISRYIPSLSSKYANELEFDKYDNKYRFYVDEEEQKQHDELVSRKGSKNYIVINKNAIMYFTINSQKMVLFRGMFTNSYESANFLGDFIVQLV